VTGSWINLISFALIATNILLMVTGSRIPQKILNVINHMLLFPPPIIIMIVTQATGYNGYSNGNAACYFGPVQIGSEDNGLTLLLTVVPFYTAIAWGYLMILLTFIVVGKRAGIKAIMKQGRLLLFAAVYGSWLLLSLIVPMQNVTGKQISGVQAYYKCLVSNWIQSQLFRHPKVRK